MTQSSIAISSGFFCHLYHHDVGDEDVGVDINCDGNVNDDNHHLGVTLVYEDAIILH